MPITVVWDTVLANVLVKTYSGSWTWQDFDAAEQQVNDYLASSPGRLDIIVDTRQNVMLQAGIKPKLTRFINSLSPRIGICILVGNPFMREIMIILAQEIPAYRQRYRFAATIDEARQLIQDDRDGNPPPPLPPPYHLN